MSTQHRVRQSVDDRTTRSLAGLAMALFLVVIGLFLTQKLTVMATEEDCLLAGRTTCAPLDDGGP